MRLLPRRGRQSGKPAGGPDHAAAQPSGQPGLRHQPAAGDRRQRRRRPGIGPRRGAGQPERARADRHRERLRRPGELDRRSGQGERRPAPGGGVVVTVAGTDPRSADPPRQPVPGSRAAIAAVADPALPVQVVPASLYLIVLTAEVIHDPLVSWDAIAAGVRAALAAGFGYGQRDSARTSRSATCSPRRTPLPECGPSPSPAWRWCPPTVSATDLSPSCRPCSPARCRRWRRSRQCRPVGACRAAAPAAAAIAYLSGAAPDTLILSEQSP